MKKDINEITLGAKRGIKIVMITIVIWFILGNVAWIGTPLFIYSLKISPEDKIATTKKAIAWLQIIPFGFMIPTIWGIWLATQHMLFNKVTHFISWTLRFTAIIFFIIRGIIFALRLIDPMNMLSGLFFVANIVFMIFFLFGISYLTAVFFQKQKRLLAGISIALSFIYAFGGIFFEETFIIKFFNPKILTSLAYSIAIWVHVIAVGITTIILLKKYSKII